MTLDNQYAIGAFCTWHNYLNCAIPRRRIVDGATAFFICPHCKSEVREVTLESWIADMAASERKSPGEGEAMALWSRGRCFPDYDTLVNAYRQAMEE